jgi:hypothetical protein
MKNGLEILITTIEILYNSTLQRLTVKFVRQKQYKPIVLLIGQTIKIVPCQPSNEFRTLNMSSTMSFKSVFH